MLVFIDAGKEFFKRKPPGATVNWVKVRFLTRRKKNGLIKAQNVHVWEYHSEVH